MYLLLEFILIVGLHPLRFPSMSLGRWGGRGYWCQLYYPNWEILLSWLKPYSPNDEDTLGPNQGMSTILSQLGNTFILIETILSQWGYIRPQSGYVNYTIPIGRYFYPDWNHTLPMRIQIGPNQGMSTILSQLGDTFILIETILSQWGYIRPQSGYVNYNIPIGRYFYPDWNPILPMMRIHYAPIRVCQLYYPNWEILLSWLKPYSPNADTALGNVVQEYVTDTCRW